MNVHGGSCPLAFAVLIVLAPSGWPQRSSDIGRPKHAGAPIIGSSPTKAVHRQRDLVRGMVNGDAVYLCQRAAGPEEQFVVELQLGVDLVVPFDKRAVEVGLAHFIAGFVHDCSDHFAFDGFHPPPTTLCRSRRSIQTYPNTIRSAGA
jgi:hypothetical protein